MGWDMGEQPRALVVDRALLVDELTRLTKKVSGGEGLFQKYKCKDADTTFIVEVNAISAIRHVLMDVVSNEVKLEFVQETSPELSDVLALVEQWKPIVLAFPGVSTAIENYIVGKGG